MGTASTPPRTPLPGVLARIPLLLLLASRLALAGALALGAPAAALEPAALGAPPLASAPAAGALTVVLFVSHDCPICTASMPEVQRIADDYGGRGVTLSVVLEDSDLTPQAARDWAAAYCPRLQPVLDGDHARARTLQAHTTPEAVVLGSDGTVRYRGRIDDGWLALGRPRLAPTSHDLRCALDDLLAGQRVRQPTTPTVGCIIDDDDRRKP